MDRNWRSVPVPGVAPSATTRAAATLTVADVQRRRGKLLDAEREGLSGLELAQKAGDDPAVERELLGMLTFHGTEDSTEGDGFDHEEVPDPRSADRMHLHHGRGVFLMRELMDECVYRKGGTEVVLYKSLA